VKEKGTQKAKAGHQKMLDESGKENKQGQKVTKEKPKHPKSAPVRNDRFGKHSEAKTEEMAKTLGATCVDKVDTATHSRRKRKGSEASSVSELSDASSIGSTASKRRKQSSTTLGKASPSTRRTGTRTKRKKV
jgi:hypothetical protein